MHITSSVFENNDPIPSKYSRAGEDINPPLTFSEIPENAESLALIVVDPDAPGGAFAHWILYNMTPATLQITEGELPISGVQGMNDYGENTYGGPQPPSGTHNYIFRLIALNTVLEFDDETVQVDQTLFFDAIEDHVIETTEIIGTFSAP